MKFLDPRIRIALCVVMALLSYFVSVMDFVDGDTRSGVLLAVGGLFFTYIAVRRTREYLAVD